MPKYGKPAYANPGNDALYGGTAGAEPGEPAHDESSERETMEEAVLPKSILAGKDFKVGEEVVLRITAIHDDSISVTYAPEEKSEQPPKEEITAPSGPAPKDQEMASMMGGY